tara:strand:- start:329 stop:514 length:186 start_codon:yes stop_codon:yes gene_type:complete
MSDEYLIKDPNKTLAVNDDEGNTHAIKLDGIDTGWSGATEIPFTKCWLPSAKMRLIKELIF